MNVIQRREMEAKQFNLNIDKNLVAAMKIIAAMKDTDVATLLRGAIRDVVEKDIALLPLTLQEELERDYAIKDK